MKYWVFKDSRILGPFDRAAFAGLPGVDSGTLVSVGDAAGRVEGDWRPASEIDELAGLGLDRASWAVLTEGDVPAFQGVLDRLQLDAAGLVGDDDFPDVAESLFQDPVMKQGFADLLRPRAGETESPELRAARERAAGLEKQVEELSRRLKALENSRAEMIRRLAQPDAAPDPAASAAAPADAPPPPTAESAAGALPAIPTLPPGAWEPAPAPSSGGGTPGLPGLPGLPSLPQGVSGGQTPLPAQDAPAVPAPAPSPAKISFIHKKFRVVPRVKTFKVVGEGEAVPPAGAAPAPAADAAPAVPEPILAPIPGLTPAAVPASLQAPGAFGAPPLTAGPAAGPDALAALGAAPAPMPVSLTPAPPPPPPADPPPPPAGAPLSAFDALVGAPATPSAPPPTDPGAGAPPATMQVSAGSGAPPAPGGEANSPDAVLARLARPSAPVTAPAAPRPRSKKPFIIAGVLLAVVLVVGAVMFRSPKDVQEMASLDDGRPRMGAEENDPNPPAARPPLPPPQASPAPAPTPAPAQADAAAPLNAAVEMVKGFPLDGDRGTVGAWLQYQYAASADAGKEEWSASAKGDGAYLVEYKVTPPPGSANPGVVLLFEADMPRFLVIGKSPEARQMLAGTPPAVEDPPKPKPKKKTAAAKPKPRSAPRVEEPKEVPLLPLPGDGELRPPAEDDGTFGSDTIRGGGL